MTPGGAETRAILALPGRGAYTAAALGSLADDSLLGEVDRLREEHGLPPLAELDAAEALTAPLHLRPANVAPLTYLASLREARSMAADHDVVAIVGNGLGWCTALAAAGALSSTDGLRLVQEIGIAQERPVADGGPGGQLLYPLVDLDWRPIAERAARVESAVPRGSIEAWLSIELGPYAVIGGTEHGLAAAASELAPITVGGRTYPYRLALHGPDHTPLAGPVAAAVAPLARLGWSTPHTTLIDGRGARHTPWSADPAELATYTLGDYLTTTYRFAASVRVALREYAPDRVLVPGPGRTLAGIVGGVIAGEGYRGIRQRAAFAREQAGPNPLVVGAA